MASIRKKNNSYEIRVSCGYDVSGKQKFQQMTWKPDEGMTPKQIEKEVNRQAILFEEACKRGQITANVKFETFAEQWFEEYAKLNLRSTSYEKLKQLPQRVYPAFGHMRLDKITGRHIQRFINDLALNGKNKKNSNPLSRKTVIHHLNFISDIFKYAVQMNMLSDNPCRNVSIPKGEKKEKEIYTLEEIAQIFELLDGKDVSTKYRVFIKLAVYSGFRRGELLGLEWKDINWENNLISVRRTSNYTVEQGNYTDTTKTKMSQRTLKFPDHIMELLQELKTEQEIEAERVGSKWVNTDRLFTKWDGSPMGNCTPYSWFRKFCKKNDIRFCDLHSLRHHNNMKTLLLNLKYINTYPPAKRKLSNEVIPHWAAYCLWSNSELCDCWNKICVLEEINLQKFTSTFFSAHAVLAHLICSFRFHFPIFLQSITFLFADKHG